jgi:hypothetical protein
VSLEIHHHARHAYISWWPAPADADKGFPFSERLALPKTYEEDLYYEMSATTRNRLPVPGSATPQWKPDLPVNKRLNPRDDQPEMMVQLRRTTPEGRLVPATTPDGRPVPETERVQRGLAYVQMPATTFVLLGKDDVGSEGIGLNLERILDWWEVFQRTQNPGYRMVSQTMNCASVVGRALEAGGASLFTRGLDERTWFWNTPLDVLNFAQQLQEQTRFLASYRRFFRGAVLPLREGGLHRLRPLDWRASMSPTPIARFTGDLMTYTKWVELSDRNIKTFFGYARRKEQVAEIDVLLKQYHELAWPHGLDNRERRYVEKTRLLNAILEQVHDHMREKPNSDRAEAVFILGRQVVYLIDCLQER